jgi:sec-independent protein translocase protein TatB
MFDFDFGKLMVVAIVALAVIPPKDLPRVMRTVGQVVGKMRRMAAEFQGQFMDAMREADLESVRKELNALNEKAKIDASFDPVAMVRDDVTKAAERPAEIGTSQVSLNAPEAAPPFELTPRVEADLESVRKELDALNEKAKFQAAFDPVTAVREDAMKAAPHPAIGMSEVSLNPPEAAPPVELPPRVAPPAPETPAPAEAHRPEEAPAAKQSAAE